MDVVVATGNIDPILNAEYDLVTHIRRIHNMMLSLGLAFTFIEIEFNDSENAVNGVNLNKSHDVDVILNCMVQLLNMEQDQFVVNHYPDRDIITSLLSRPYDEFVPYGEERTNQSIANTINNSDELVELAYMCNAQIVNNGEDHIEVSIHGFSEDDLNPHSMNMFNMGFLVHSGDIDHVWQLLDSVFSVPIRVDIHAI